MMTIFWIIYFVSLLVLGVIVSALWYMALNNKSNNTWKVFGHKLTKIWQVKVVLGLLAMSVFIPVINTVFVVWAIWGLELDKK